MESINYCQATKRWCQFVDDYNAACPTQTTTKTSTLPNGSKVVHTYTRPVGTIKGSVKATGMHLIAQYAEVFNQSNQVLHGCASPKDVFLATNRVELAAKLNKSERTVYDHIVKLRQVGLVDKYKFCGRNRSFLLWINPKVLFEAESDNAAQKAQKRPLSQPVRQNLPLYDISKKQPSTTIKNVDTVETGKHYQRNNENPHSLGQKASNVGKASAHKETTAGGGGAATKNYNALAASFGRLPQHLRALVIQFWLLARTNLYSRYVDWSDEENSQALLEIFDGVFGRFELKQSQSEWETYYNQLTERVELAKNWLNRNPHVFPDKPYQRGAKLGYFDRNNNKGFAVTAQWYAKDQLRKKENRIDYLLRQARSDFERLRGGNPRPMHQHKDETQLFLYYQQIARTYGATADKRFCEQYLDQKSRNFSPAKPPRLSIRAQKSQKRVQAAQVIVVEPWMEFSEGFYSL
jgi:DNA-binding transcriptional ArsR family regulator